MILKNFFQTDPVVRSILLTLNGALWLAFCVRIVRHWYLAPWNPLVFGIILAIVLPLLWQELLREKSSNSVLMGVTLVFIGVSGLAVQAF